MPRKKASAETGSAFRQVQKQARMLLANLRKDIRAKQMELSRLKDEESRLSSLVGRSGKMAAAGGRAGGVSGGGRINWRSVLAQLPKQFKASDVRNVRGLKQKRPSEIFAAITRWIDGGMAKRKARGLYEKA
jgi:hypothetical protein